MPYVPSPEEVRGYFDRLTNWGRWGKDDELGTLNLITPQKRLEAIAAVRDGVAIGCARPILTEPPATDVATPPLHYMLTSGEAKGARGAMDFMGLAPHGLTVSHVDTLGHHFWRGRMYNDRPTDLITTREGSTVCSIETMKDGIVTRGVLLDIAKLKGRPYLDAGEPIFPEDLEAAEAAEGVVLREGDALIVRTGWYRRRVEHGPATRSRPGLHAATLPWLHERGIALVASDAAEDVFPSGYEDPELPLHTIGIAAMGLCLLDSCQFEDLAVECERRGRYAFLFVVAPLRWRYATGSPVTPVALL